MKRIGLTGNIGTGKSTVARIFNVLGVPVYHADIQSRVLLDTEDVKLQISSLFGKHLIDLQNKVDRKALAQIVFNDKEKLTVLNKLIHPLVEEDFKKWCNNQLEQVYVLHETAILFESGFDRLFDANILVTAPEELCITRVMARDGIPEQMVTDRMKNQWTQEKKQKLSDYLVVNDENPMLIPQVLAIHSLISKR